MRINAIGSNYSTDYNKTNFKGLIKDQTALPVIKTMSKADRTEFKKIKQRLSKTKNWDLKISTIGNVFNEFKYHFIHKTGKHGVITEGIYPYDRQGKNIKFYSIVYGPENVPFNTIETLSFKTEKKAETLYNRYRENILHLIDRGFNITPLESLKMKEVELNMLEEAVENTKGKPDKTQLATELQTKSFIGNKLRFDKT